MRRYIQILGWTLIWTGVFVFGYLGWQLFGTDLINARVQEEAETQLEATLEESRSELPEVEQISDGGGPGDGNGSTEAIEYHREPDPAENREFAFMSVPKVGLEAVVFEGVARATLTKGPGHMPGTALPGQPGNSVISGHRTTYGRPFYDFEMLEPGDVIEVETAIGLHTYLVREVFIVQPTDVWVTDHRDGAWLTLTTCNPKFSARERLIVTAEMVDGPNLDYVEYLSRL